MDFYPLGNVRASRTVPFRINEPLPTLLDYIKTGTRAMIWKKKLMEQSTQTAFIQTPLCCFHPQSETRNCMTFLAYFFVLYAERSYNWFGLDLVVL